MINETKEKKESIEYCLEEVCSKYFNDKKDSFFIIRLIKYIIERLNEIKTTDSSKHINIETIDSSLEALYSLLIQNYLQSNDSKRVKDFKYKKYFNIKTLIYVILALM